MRFKLTIITVLLLIAGYSLFWFKMADRVEATTLAWIEAQKDNSDGLKVFVGDLTVTGFPYKIIVQASSLNIIIAAGDYSTMPILVNIPKIAAVFQPWKPYHGMLVTDYFDVVIGDIENPKTSIAFDQVKASVIVDEDSMALNNFSIISQKLSWHKGAPIDDNELSIMENAEFHLRRTPGKTIRESSYDLPVNMAIYFKANNVIINEFKSNFLGQKADQVILETFLHANIQPKYSVASLSKWRDEGGTLSIRNFEYGNQDTKFNLNGDVTLDENLKPLGAFDAKITDMNKFLSNLSTSEGLSQSGRAFLRSQSNNNSLPKDMPLSLSMQNGYLYIGPIQILKLDPVVQ